MSLTVWQLHTIVQPARILIRLQVTMPHTSNMPSRVVVLLCVLVAVPVVVGPAVHGQGQLAATVYATGFTTPIAIVQHPTVAAAQLVVEQGGRIRTVQAGTIVGDFLDLRSATAAGGERGLLGLAFAPDFATSGRIYVNFTNLSGDTVVARFKTTNPLVADPASRFDLKWAPSGLPFIPQPYANHNGGHLAFGPDGFLYIGMGDGGSGDDPEHRAQNPGELLGKMLRIDVNVPDTDPAGYRVPADNPFVSSGPAGTRPEIWSFGLRNPWRFTFDSGPGGTGALIIGDVGQTEIEEIDYEPARRGGRNYGWRNREGAHPHVTSRAAAFLPLVDPIFEYDHGQGNSITGGYVYRGASLDPSYKGRYFFADFVRGRVWSLGLSISASGDATATNLIEHTADFGGGAMLGNVSSFGIDSAGDLFIVNYAGTILRVIDVGAPSPPKNLRIRP